MFHHPGLRGQTSCKDTRLNMLRIVRPNDAGQESPRKPKRNRINLTDAENDRLRLVLKNLRRAYGTWSVLAEVMGVSVVTLHNIGRGKRGSHGIAVLAARAAGLPVEEVLSGGIALAKHCPLCGAPHRGAQAREKDSAGSGER
jgi:hypothetical protein